MKLYGANGFPNKIAICGYVRQALRRGTLQKFPCWNCNEPKTVGHHVDYSMPLDVVWLCHRCHMKLHGDVKKWLRERRPRNGIHPGHAQDRLATDL